MSRNVKAFQALQSRVVKRNKNGKTTQNNANNILDDSFGEGPDVHHRPNPLPVEPNRETRARLGNELSEKAKYLTDSQWDQIPLQEKSYFVKTISDKLKREPAEVSEQQRRRFYETTTHNVRFEPESISNPYQRMKVGLPFEMDTKGRRITVSEALMESANDIDFDPHNAKNIEYAQMHFKQAFKDYMSEKKAGRSTETSRRQIAAMAESLQYEVQKHLANSYKYADAKLHDVVKQSALERLKSLAKAKAKAEKILKGDDGEGESSSSSSPQPVARLARKYGFDTKLADALWTSFRSQEMFFEELEVLSRLTSGGKGFTHTAKDESLDEYADRLSTMLSLNPEKAGELDVVKYYAQLEQADPIDWAKRWYEKNLVYPIHASEEYEKLVALASSSNNTVVQQAANNRLDKVRHFTELMIVTHPQLTKEFPVEEQLQQKRLRHLAYTYMQVQIKRMRAKCLKYQSVDLTQETEDVKRLVDEMKSLQNDFTNPRVLELHRQVMDIVKHVVETKGKANLASQDNHQQGIAEAILSGDRKRVTEEVRAAERRRRAEQVLRMVRVLEEDIKADIQWQQDFESAERPPLIPVPQQSLYVSAADVAALRVIHDKDNKIKSDPFKKKSWNVELLGRPVDLPTRPTVFWGTGTSALGQALRLAVDEAHERRRVEATRAATNNDDGNEDGGDGNNNTTPDGGSAGPYSKERNPWGWRVNANNI